MAAYGSSSNPLVNTGLLGRKPQPTGLNQQRPPRRGREIRPNAKREALAARVALTRQRANRGGPTLNTGLLGRRPTTLPGPQRQARPVEGARPMGPPGNNAAQVSPNAAVMVRPRSEDASARGASLGRQLSRRVASGAIDQAQAQRTANQRQLLKWAFGKDWRTQIGGGPGNVRLAREALAKEPQNPLVRANYEALTKRRSQLIKHARGMRAGGPARTEPYAA